MNKLLVYFTRNHGLAGRRCEELGENKWKEGSEKNMADHEKNIQSQPQVLLAAINGNFLFVDRAKADSSEWLGLVPSLDGCK